MSFLKQLENTLVYLVIFLILLLLLFKFFRNNIIEPFKKKDKIIVKCLKIKEAKSIFNDKLKASQINLYTESEIVARFPEQNINKNLDIKNLREKVREIYSKNVKKFTKKEVKQIKQSVKKLHYIIQKYNKKNNITIPLLKKWKFIKMSKKIDWGFPYTLHNYIILPETIVADIKDSPFSKNILKTLLHEQFHILQRKYPDLFKNFYTNWNFFSSSGLILPDKIKKLLITNPDAPKANLMFKYNDSRFILPVLTVNDEDKKTHKPVFLPVSYTEGQFRVDESLVNTTQFKQIVRTYRKRFYNIKQNYHPNEIFANLIPNMIFENLKLEKKDQQTLANFFNQNTFTTPEKITTQNQER